MYIVSGLACFPYFCFALFIVWYERFRRASSTLVLSDSIWKCSHLSVHFPLAGPPAYLLAFCENIQNFAQCRRLGCLAFGATVVKKTLRSFFTVPGMYLQTRGQCWSDQRVVIPRSQSIEKPRLIVASCVLSRLCAASSQPHQNGAKRWLIGMCESREHSWSLLLTRLKMSAFFY